MHARQLIFTDELIMPYIRPSAGYYRMLKLYCDIDFKNWMKVHKSEKETYANASRLGGYHKVGVLPCAVQIGKYLLEKQYIVK